MNFFGRVWKEGDEIRGKVELTEEDASSRPFYFKNFDELRMLLENEFGKQNP